MPPPRYRYLEYALLAGPGNPSHEIDRSRDGHFSEFFLRRFLFVVWDDDFFVVVDELIDDLVVIFVCPAMLKQQIRVAQSKQTSQ